MSGYYYSGINNITAGSATTTNIVYITDTGLSGGFGCAYSSPQRKTESALEWLDRRVNEVRVRL